MQLGVLAGSQLLGGFGMKLATLGASVAGSLLLNGKKKPQGKLNDLRVSSSSYGRGIPIVEGTMRVTGNMIWATNFEEEKSYVTQKGKRKNGSLGKKKSKKGKATETYEYFANFAMGLCEGPVDSIIRIWADNNLIYDKLNRDDDDDPLVEIGFSKDNDDGGGKAAMKSPARKKGHQGDSGRFQFRFYNGSEDQLPDPYMVEKQGDNAVAFRGLSYLMFEKFALADFGNRTPTITAEITMSGQRKPIVRVFENLEPKTGWDDAFLGKETLDPIRKRFYHTAQRDGVTYLRVYDMERFKEIKRIAIAPPSAVSQLPQTFVPTDGGAPFSITDFGPFIGVSAQGDLMFQYPLGNNYNPIIWVNPNSMQVVKYWGEPGNLGTLEPYKQLSRPVKASPFIMNGSDAQASPTAVTAVTTLDSGVAFFDESRDDPTPRVFARRYAASGSGGLSPGAYGTDAAIIMAPSNIYSLTGQIFAAPVDEPIQGAGDGTVNIVDQKLFYKFPTDVDDPNDDVFISGINFAGYCAGARAIVIIANIISGSTDWPVGLYAMSIDPQTKERLWIERMEGFGTNDGPRSLDMPCYLGGNKFSWLTGSGSDLKYITVDFRAEEWSVLSVTPSMVPGNDYRGTYYYSDLEALFYMTGDVNDDEFNWVLASVDKRVQTETTVSDICYDMATRVGIPPERLDFSAMTADEKITGYMIENPTPAKEVLEELANVFMFDVIESDNMLKFKTRGTESLITIPQDDLGIVESDFGTDNEYYTETRQQEVELPERVNVSYIDPKQEYETGTEHYKRPLKPLSVMSSRELLELTLNMAMRPSYAKTIAKRVLFAAWSERTSHTYTLPRDYLIYEPSDVITVELENGERFTDRITDAEIGADLSMQITTVSHIATSYKMTTTVDTPGGMIKLPTNTSPSVKAGVFDVPYLSDGDVDEGGSIVYYWGALAYDDGFRFGALMAQVPGNDSDIAAYTSYDSLWGVTAGMVQPPKGPAEVTDFDTKITLVPAFDFNATTVTYVWESIPDSEWPSEKNMVIIGDEVILFKDVTVNAEGAATISTLIRGAKGTGYSAFTHTKSGEEWVLVLPGTIQTAEEYVDNLNVSEWFTIQSQSYLPPAATKTTKKLTGATRRPWQVGSVKRTNLNTGDIKLDWSRATRWGGSLMNGNSNVPLNEESERYEIFLLKAAFNPKTWDPDNGDLYWMTTSMFTTPSFTFGVDDLSDFGLTDESDIHVVIYQISATVGRGFPRGLTLPYTTLSL